MKKIYPIAFAISVCLCVYSCKKSNSPEADLKTSQNLSKSVSQNVKNFTDFFEKKKDLNRNSEYVSEYQPLSVTVEEYVSTLDESSNVQFYKVHDAVEEISVPEALEELDPDLSPAQAAYEIKNSMSSVISIKNFFNELPSQNSAVSQNLEILESNLVALANDEVSNIASMQEIDIINEDLAATEMENRLKNRVMSCINNHVTVTNYNIGLTENQKTTIAVGALYAMQTVQNITLISNISFEIHNALNETLTTNLNQKITDGLFGKIGKLLKKVVKSVAVVVWSAVAIVGSVIVATIMDDKNTPEMVTNTRAGLGFLAGISYVTSNSKKWWRWALR